jgi:transposase
MSANPWARAGKSAVILPRPSRLVPPDFDRHLYKERHLVENSFCKLKQFRAIATRYDKTAPNFLAAIHLAAAIVWLIDDTPDYSMSPSVASDQDGACFMIRVR